MRLRWCYRCESWDRKGKEFREVHKEDASRDGAGRSNDKVQEMERNAAAWGPGLGAWPVVVQGSQGSQEEFICGDAIERKLRGRRRLGKD
jgi:hypothetical protein